MNLDLILFIAFLAAAALLIRVAFRGRQQQRGEYRDRVMTRATGRKRTVLRLVRFLVAAIFALFVLYAFLVEPFRVNSGSMLPTLQVDDFVLVNKSAYDLRLPLSGYRVITTGTPRHGDVAVFQHPRDEGGISVKRIVGVPGDWLVYRGKQLSINGVTVSRRDLGIYAGRGVTRYLDGARLAEEVVGETEYRVFLMPNAVVPPDDFEMQMPAGHYFVLGDNRDNSQDSRDWGLVPAENLIGRVFFNIRFPAQP